MNLHIVKKAILDILFPIHCHSCQTEGFWLCDRCFDQVKLTDFQVCPFCEKNVTDKGSLCPACREARMSSLDSLIVATTYENSAVKSLLHNFKYRFIPGISEPLGSLMVKSLIKNDVAIPDIIAPVPLHPRRLRWRGFNQSRLLSESIAAELAPLLEIEVLDILERKKYNRPQMKIKNYAERFRNMKDIFGLSEKFSGNKFKGKKIMLVDDISTTGATLEECAKVLKAQGAKKVTAAVIARQTLKK